jgi:hypothetical protein
MVSTLFPCLEETELQYGVDRQIAVARFEGIMAEKMSVLTFRVRTNVVCTCT